MTKKIVLKSLNRRVSESATYVEYEYSPVRAGIQQLQMICMAHENIKIKINKIKPKKATLTITGDKDVIADLFTMLALTDFSDKYCWKFKLF